MKKENLWLTSSTKSDMASHLSRTQLSVTAFKFMSFKCLGLLFFMGVKFFAILHINIYRQRLSFSTVTDSYVFALVT